MSIFSETRCSISPNDQPTLIAVSNTTIQPLLAIATYNKILFYSDNGEKKEQEIQRNTIPTYIEWHPMSSILIIGWQNGLITLWNSDENKDDQHSLKQAITKEDLNVHKSQITMITFNPSGSRMVTCDEKGTVAVWRGLSCLATYQKEGAITHCIFCELHLDKEKPEPKEESKGGQSIKEHKKSSQNLFFFGGKQGVVCVADDLNHCTEVCKVGGAVKSLLFFEKENSIIIITSTLLLVQFKISLTEKSVPDKKVKLSIAGDPEQLMSIWIGQSLLITSAVENMLRAWHIENDENYLLTLADVEDKNPGSKLMTDKVIGIKYDSKNRVLIGGTKLGNAIFWKNNCYGSDSPTDNDQWRNLPLINFGNEPITQISVGKGSSMIAFKYGQGISIVYETFIRGKMSDNVKILQIAAKSLQIYVKQELTSSMVMFTSKSNIRSTDCYGKNFVVWNGKQVEVYEILADVRETTTKLINQFNFEKALTTCIHKENIIVVQENGLNVTNFQGVSKQTFSFPESEGKIREALIHTNYLLVYTTSNYIRIYDLSKREYKQIGVTRKFEDSKGPLGDIKKCVINFDGTKVAIVATPRKGSSQHQNGFFIYDVDVDNFSEYIFDPYRTPIDVYWDISDKRFFAVQTEWVRPPFNPDQHTFTSLNEEFKGKELMTFFVSSEHGIKNQDTYRLEQDIEAVFGLSVPNINYIGRTTNQDNILTGYKILEKPLRDFNGLDKIDDHTKKAIMNFSFYLTVGNMDEAYKSVKYVQNPLVWENMAQMCVKTKRLDVAEICLGNMKFARGAKAVRESKAEDSIEPQLAMVAIQLNMKDEAQKLYEKCKRYDLLNNMHQAAGEWDKAIQVAENYDRISLKTTYFRMAKQFEISRDFYKAIEYYEKSDTHRKEVPRMLMQAGEWNLLERYVEDSKDKSLYKWWAAYQESQKKIPEALKYYKLAEDISSIVRILIFQEELNKAIEICEDTGDPAASFYVAKQFEMRGQISEAIQLYAKAQQVSVAIKLAMENGMDNEIMALALTGTKPVMLKSAAYFEHKGYNEKAVILYIKGRNFKKALDLSVKYKLFDYIKKITGEIDEDADPEVLSNVAAHFMENNQQDKAVHLLIASNQIEKALELCIEYNIPITEDIVEKIIPNKNNESAVDQKKRLELTRLIAKKAKKQGNFALAGKKYMDLGEKVKAAKCLIKLGDVDKAITFANNARMPEIYILTANFLQNSDWHNNPDIMRHIINFYTKAKAFDHLAGFFDACAAVEVDEYRDYEKAGDALKEALKFAMKSQSQDKEFRIQQFETKIMLVEKFVQAKKLQRSNPTEMMKICQSLLENPNLELALRSGDVFAQMIEYYYEQNKMEPAFKLIKMMQDRGIILNPYLDQEMVENIFNANGVTNVKKSANRQQMNHSDEEIEENI